MSVNAAPEHTWPCIVLQWTSRTSTIENRKAHKEVGWHRRPSPDSIRTPTCVIRFHRVGCHAPAPSRSARRVPWIPHSYLHSALREIKHGVQMRYPRRTAACVERARFTALLLFVRHPDTPGRADRGESQRQ